MIQVEEIKLSRVKTNKENPRTITKDKFDKLVNSILVFPKMLQLRPIVVDGKMTALGGNMRNEALRVIAKMQPEEIAERLAGIADFAKKTKGERDALVEHWGKWLENPTAYIVKAGDLSEQEREQFIVKDNVSFGTWNYDALSSKWDSSLLNDWGMDVWQAAPAAFQPTTDSTGYVPSAPDASEVDDENSAEPMSVEEDDFSDEEAERSEPRVKPGDIWQLGEHRLMCGDSTDADSVALLMDCEKADMVFTDPPFGNNVGYGRGQLGVRRILNDENTDVLESMFDPIDGVLKNNSHCLVWIQWRTYPKLVSVFGKYHLRTVIIWDKKQAGLSGGGFAEQYEMLCVFIKGKATQKEYCGNVWQCSRVHDNREKSEHPHKKPIEILAKALHLCSNKDDLILDIFGGSGSTLIACEQLNRKCYMMELDPHYCDVIIARWEKLTGKKACKVA